MSINPSDTPIELLTISAVNSVRVVISNTLKPLLMNLIMSDGEAVISSPICLSCLSNIRIS